MHISHCLTYTSTASISCLKCLATHWHCRELKTSKQYWRRTEWKPFSPEFSSHRSQRFELQSSDSSWFELCWLGTYQPFGMCRLVGEFVADTILRNRSTYNRHFCLLGRFYVGGKPSTSSCRLTRWAICLLIFSLWGLVTVVYPHLTLLHRNQ